jgi:hypothetical protein
MPENTSPVRDAIFSMYLWITKVFYQAAVPKRLIAGSVYPMSLYYEAARRDAEDSR